jgi:hypothetical protein
VSCGCYECIHTIPTNCTYTYIYMYCMFVVMNRTVLTSELKKTERVKVRTTYEHARTRARNNMHAACTYKCIFRSCTIHLVQNCSTQSSYNTFYEDCLIPHIYHTTYVHLILSYIFTEIRRHSTRPCKIPYSILYV